jgi:twitching motility two-component system response regulator PilH
MTKILVVDDIKAELNLISLYLTEAGYSIVTAQDEKQAVQKAMTSKPDAIVTDSMIRPSGGLDLCRQLKKNPEMANIPAITCTAKDRDVDGGDETRARSLCDQTMHWGRTC